MRTIHRLLALASAAACIGCGGGGSGGSPSTAAAPISSATPSSSVSASVTDPTLVPSAPADATWYFRTDDPTTPDNEAARDLAVAIAAANNGLTEAFVFEHL